MYHILFVHSSILGHMGCFYLLTIVWKTFPEIAIIVVQQLQYLPFLDELKLHFLISSYILISRKVYFLFLLSAKYIGSKLGTHLEAFSYLIK